MTLGAASVLACCATLLVVSGQPEPVRAPGRDGSGAAALGWRLGLQAWTFRDRTAFEAIDGAARLGLTFIELYPGQPLSTDEPKAEVGPRLSAAQVAALKKKLDERGVTAVSYGVVTIKNDEAEARKSFEFVRAMGMRTLVCEPAPEARDLVSRLAEEYHLRAAIHNHPKPSLYWNPDTVLEALKGRSALMGACADTGHWPRSGLRAIDGLKKLEGHIVELHFKDITAGKDVVWGTGESDVRAMLAELKRQKFAGEIYVEYEEGKGKAVEESVASCVEFFDREANALAAGPGR